MLVYIHRRYPINYFILFRHHCHINAMIIVLQNPVEQPAGQPSLDRHRGPGRTTKTYRFSDKLYMDTYILYKSTYCVYIYKFIFSCSLRYTAFYLDNHGYTNMSMDTSDVLYHFLSAAFINTHSMNDRMCICKYEYTLV